MVSERLLNIKYNVQSIQTWQKFKTKNKTTTCLLWQFNRSFEGVSIASPSFTAGMIRSIGQGGHRSTFEWIHPTDGVRPDGGGRGGFIRFDVHRWRANRVGILQPWTRDSRGTESRTFMYIQICMATKTICNKLALLLYIISLT